MRLDLDRHPAEVAPELLGARLVSLIGGCTVVVELDEVEAYAGDRDDAAHSRRGPTNRCRTMFGPSGRLYVYRSYGLHWCANLVVEPEGVGSAILLRGGVVTTGRDLVEARRGRTDHLADGPGKLCQALAITGEHDGLDLLDARSPVRLEPGRRRPFAATRRVGITRAVDLRWRFVVGADAPQAVSEGSLAAPTD